MKRFKKLILPVLFAGLVSTSCTVKPSFKKDLLIAGGATGVALLGTYIFDSGYKYLYDSEDRLYSKGIKDVYIYLNCLRNNGLSKKNICVETPSYLGKNRSAATRNFLYGGALFGVGITGLGYSIFKLCFGSNKIS